VATVAYILWVAVVLIAIGLVWVVITGSYRDVARFLWPIAFDEVRGPEMIRRTECAAPTMWATGLIVMPVMLALVAWLYRETRLWVKVLAGVGFFIFYMLVAKSALPDKVVRLIEPNIELRLPAHCQQPAS
jgi:hypothetical protein